MENKDLKIGNWYHKKNDFKVLIEIQRIIVIDEVSENGDVFCHYLEGPKIGKTYSYKIDDIVPAFLHSHHLSYLFDSPKINPSEREINDDAGFDLYYHHGVHYAFNGVNIYEYEVENDKDHERKVVRPVSEGMEYVNELQDFINLKEISKNLS